VWVMYDTENMYVACRCWDASPPGKWIANELRRDTNQLRQNDHFGIMFDTFYDRRSGFAFYANPLGARALYLGKTLYRIHGTNQPSTIGQFVSSGCIRLLNEDVEDLYGRVQVGTRVVVLPGRAPSAAATPR